MLAVFGVGKRSSAIFVVLTSDRAHLLMSSDGAHFAAFFPVAAHAALTFVAAESQTIGGFGRNDRFSYTQLCLSKSLSGANAFEISDIQESET